MFEVVVFDFDGTLLDVPQYLWPILHDEFGIPKEYRNYHYKQFMDGNSTYEEWFLSDVHAWRDHKVHKNDLSRVLGTMSLIQGAREVIIKLQKSGIQVCILSGSIDTALYHFFQPDEFSKVLMNEVHFDEKGYVSGGLATKYDMDGKRHGLEKLAETIGVPISKVVFIGDNSNDITALQVAGLGIAFHPKNKAVEEAADVVVHDNDLREVLSHILQ